MSNSVRPHRRWPTRLPCPWDWDTGVGCHFLLQCMKLKSESEVAQSCLTLRNPMDCSLPGSFVHGISQARVLEWAAIAFSERVGYPATLLTRSPCAQQKTHHASRWLTWPPSMVLNYSHAGNSAIKYVAPSRNPHVLGPCSPAI